MVFVNNNNYNSGKSNVDNSNLNKVASLDSDKTKDVKDFHEKNKENKEAIQGFKKAVKNENLDKKSLKNWHPSSVVQTNLIRNEVVVFINWKNNGIVAGVYFVLFLLIFGASFITIDLWEKKLEDENKRMSDITLIRQQELKDISNSQEKKTADIFKRKLGFSQIYLNKHIYWTEFFNYVEERTLKNIYYGSGDESFSGDVTGNFSFTVTGQDYRDVIDQVRIFQSDTKVLDVVVSGGSATREIEAEEENEDSDNQEVLEVSEEHINEIIETASFEMKLELKDTVFVKGDNIFKIDK